MRIFENFFDNINSVICCQFVFIFLFERIEDNQELSMTLWNERGNGIGWFALRTKDDEIYMFSHYALKGYEKVKSKLSNDEIKLYGQPIEEWIAKCK